MKIDQQARADARGGLFLVVLAAILWGTVGITFRQVATVSVTNALSLGFLRLAISVPFLLLASRFVTGRFTAALARRHVAPMLLFGTAMGLYQVCYVLAIGRVGVAIAALVTICTAPVLVALFSSVFLRERLSRQTLMALALALGGTALLVGVPGDALGSGVRVVAGILFALGSASGYAVCVLAGRVLAPHYHPLQSAGLGFAIGALALLPVALADGLLLSYGPDAWMLLIYLGVVPTAFAYALFFGALRAVPATAVAITTLIEPLTAAVLAMMLFGERLGPWGILGAALLVGGIVTLYREGARGADTA
jgi:drug/metabolite transporter, DME family